MRCGPVLPRVMVQYCSFFCFSVRGAVHALEVPSGLKPTLWFRRRIAPHCRLLLRSTGYRPLSYGPSLNVALALSICYGVQGLAVAGALAERVGLAPALRLLAPIVLILLLVSGTAGFIAIGVLALLGTLETWIPFRAAPKGELP